MNTNLNSLETFKEEIKKYNCKIVDGQIIHKSGQMLKFKFEPKFDIENSSNNKFAFEEYLFKTLEQEIKKQFGD